LCHPLATPLSLHRTNNNAIPSHGVTGWRFLLHTNFPQEVSNNQDNEGSNNPVIDRLGATLVPKTKKGAKTNEDTVKGRIDPNIRRNRPEKSIRDEGSGRDRAGC
jgi:hypothetical protein